MDLIRSGKPERDLSLELDFAMLRRGAERVSFETIVASGENTAMPHARPGTRRLENGDCIIFDFGAVFEGYHSDETCTIGLGKISNEQKDVYDIVKCAHDKAIESVRAGASCREIDAIARFLYRQSMVSARIFLMEQDMV